MAKLRSHSIGGSLLIWYDRAEAHLNEHPRNKFFRGATDPLVSRPEKKESTVSERLRSLRNHTG
ncbi:Uncharacterised protein [Raoultella planticola]|nr:Uncharacterised protein [Raoultella planticola]